MANFDYLDRRSRNIKAHLQSQKAHVRSTYIRLAERCTRRLVAIAAIRPFFFHIRAGGLAGASHCDCGDLKCGCAIFSISPARSPIQRMAPSCCRW